MLRTVGQKIISRYLDAALAVRGYVDRLDLQRRIESLPPTNRYDPHLAEELRSGDIRARVAWIRERLRRRPYWSGGHLAFARLSLRLDDIAAAYAAAHAVLKLNSSGYLAEESRLVLGRTYLRRGEWSRAIDILEGLHASRRLDAPVTEDLAAAYVGAGLHARAAETLSRLPRTMLSAEGLAALSFARARSEGEKK